MLCACLCQWLRIRRWDDAGNHTASSLGLAHWLEVTTRILRPEVVLLLGSVLLAFSLWDRVSAVALLSGSEKWITAAYGLGARIDAAEVVLNYLGRLVYGGSLVVGAGTVVWLGMRRFTGTKLRAPRLTLGLGIAAGFLAICSITDYYFSWLSFLLDRHLPHLDWILFSLFFLHWAAPLSLAAMMVRARRSLEGTGPALRAVVAFYAPLVLFDLAMTPFFSTDFGSPFILTAFLGLQLLAWGYVGLALES